MVIYIFNKQFEQKQIQQEYLLSTVFRRHSPHISRLLLQHIITTSYITKVQQPAVFNAEKVTIPKLAGPRVSTTLNKQPRDLVRSAAFFNLMQIWQFVTAVKGVNDVFPHSRI